MNYRVLSLLIGISLSCLGKKISVIIPCYYKHAQFLPELLGHLEKQTVLPDEVIISLSESDKVEPEILEKIKNYQAKFEYIVLCSPAVQYAGKNRNIGCDHATGDIFVVQDADDIPHPQRIEVIKYFFERYPIDHLMHQYLLQNHETDTLQFEPIPNSADIRYEWGALFNSTLHKQLTNGNVAIDKKVFKTIRWAENLKRGQDTDFNRKVYAEFGRCLQISVPLLYYRIFLSSR